MSNKILIGLLVVVIVIVALVSFSGKSEKANLEEIKIGLVLPLTGPYAEMGNYFKQGYEWKAEELQKAGVPIKLYVEDTASDNKQAVSAFTKLVDTDGVKIVFTTISSVSMLLKPLAEEKYVLLWADASHPKLMEGTSYLLRHSNVATDHVKYIFDAAKRAGAKKIGLIYQADDFGLAVRDYTEATAKSAGFDVVTEQVQMGSNDFRSSLSKLVAAKVDFMSHVVAGPGAGMLIKQSRDMGFNGGIHSYGIGLSPAAAETAGEAGKGVYYQAFIANNDFYTDYEKRYGKLAGKTNLSYVTYTDMEILAKAINDTKSVVPETLIAYIKKMGSFVGKYDNAEIRPNGDMIMTTKTLQWE